MSFVILHQSVSFLRHSLSLAILGGVIAAVDAVAGVEAPRPEYLTLGAGFNEAFDGGENAFASVELRFTPVFVGLRPWAYASGSDEGALLLAGGLAYTIQGDCDWSLTFGFGPGYYDRHDDVELGDDLEFMSFAEIGYRLKNDSVISLRLAHVSNGSLADYNPGTELISLQYSIPLGR